jgi:hypothetical protein
MKYTSLLETGGATWKETPSQMGAGQLIFREQRPDNVNKIDDEIALQRS